MSGQKAAFPWLFGAKRRFWGRWARPVPEGGGEGADRGGDIFAPRCEPGGYGTHQGIFPGHPAEAAGETLKSHGKRHPIPCLAGGRKGRGEKRSPKRDKDEKKTR